MKCPSALFAALRHTISLTFAFERVKANQGRAGSDGVSIQQFEQNLNQELKRIGRELETMTYHPWPLLELQVEETIFAGAASRPGGRGGVLKKKRRALRIPAVRDRVAQAAVLQIIEPWIDEQLESISFGYRHGRGVADAVEEVRKWHVRGYQYLVDADIDAFFDHVDHGRVLAKFRHAIEVPLRVALIRALEKSFDSITNSLSQSPPKNKNVLVAPAFSEAGGSCAISMEDRESNPSSRTSPPSDLSETARADSLSGDSSTSSDKSRRLENTPALPKHITISDVQFDQVLEGILRELTGLITQWVQAEVWDGRQISWLKRGLPQGSVVSPLLANLFLDELDETLLGHDLKLVRYADDFVILCKSPHQAEQALNLTRQKLAELHLGLNASKTSIRTFDDSFKFLGVFFWKDLTMLPFEKRIRERRVLSLPPPLPPELTKRYR